MRERKPVLATTLMFVVIWLSGWACSALLLHFGWYSMAVRYAASSLVSYGMFFWCVRFWCDFAVKPEKAKVDKSDWVGDPGINGVGDDEGCLIAVAIIVLAFLLSGVFFLVGGYAMLVEVAFEVAFAGTLVKSMGQEYTVGNWAGKLFRKTWLPALLVAAILVGFAAKMQHDYPQSHTLAQAFKAMRAQQR